MDLSPFLGDEGGEDAEEGGFAGAVWAEEGEDFVLVDVEGEVLEGGAVAVGVGEVGDLDDGGQRWGGVLTPLPGLIFRRPGQPTASAVGYCLAPLPGLWWAV